MRGYVWEVGLADVILGQVEFSPGNGCSVGAIWVWFGVRKCEMQLSRVRWSAVFLRMG